MDERERVIGEKVKGKSDAEFEKFKNEIAPLLKRNLIAKRRTPFNIAQNETVKNCSDIIL